MEIRPSGKQLVSIIGIGVCAGVALTVSRQRSSRKGRLLVALNPGAHRPGIKVVNSPILLPSVPVTSRPLCRDRQTPTPVSVETDIPACTSVQPIALEAAPVPDIPEAVEFTAELAIESLPVALSTLQQLEAGLLDAIIVFFASCLFVATSLSFRGSAPIDRFDISALACAVFLIVFFYAFLFTAGGRETLGQTWRRQRLTEEGEELGMFAFLAAAWAPKSTAQDEDAGFSPLLNRRMYSHFDL